MDKSDYDRSINKMQNGMLKHLFYSFLIILLATSLTLGHARESAEIQTVEQEKHDQWLKNKFSTKHEKLIPIVAVADMFFSCNQERKVDPAEYQVKFLITVMDKNTLAEKLDQCLGEDSIASDIALNFGLHGCFYEQLANLPDIERQQKMTLVNKAILSLSREDRQKSLTQCITDQAIEYLK